jgi:5-methyltetrahydropteroyltriglutamate--homocysteine methyltransferase
MAVGAVRYVDPSANAAEIGAFKEALALHKGAFTDAFMTAPSPGIVAMAMKNAHYERFGDYLAALADALRVEYKAAVDAGFILQIDAPDLALERHLSYAERPVEDFVAFVESVVGEINRALAGIPRERVRLHVCWGNYESPHDRDVPLQEIASAILRATSALHAALRQPAPRPRSRSSARCRWPPTSRSSSASSTHTTNYAPGGDSRPAGESGTRDRRSPAHPGRHRLRLRHLRRHGPPHR